MIEASDFRGWSIPLTALVVALAAVSYAVARNWLRQRRAERELLKLCQGDTDMLERLIAYEQKRTPGQSREEAAKAASYAIRRDSR